MLNVAGAWTACASPVPSGSLCFSPSWAALSCNMRLPESSLSDLGLQACTPV